MRAHAERGGADTGGSASDPRAALCLRKQAGARARKASAPLKPRSGFKSERSELPRPRSGQKRAQASFKSERSELPDREAVKTSASEFSSRRSRAAALLRKHSLAEKSGEH